MGILSPAKILVVLVVAMLVLGPEKLPAMARQIGAAWGDFRRWRSRLESEVRGVFPDLPPAHEVAQAVRSPLAFLDRLADQHERPADGATGQSGVPNDQQPTGAADATPAPTVPSATNGSSAPAEPSRPRGLPVDVVLPGVPDDPSMN